MKSEASLHIEGSMRVMKLRVQPLESAFRLTARVVRVRYFKYKYMAGAVCMS